MLNVREEQQGVIVAGLTAMKNGVEATLRELAGQIL
jgi:hypothetical protein